jgi:hypothetical protein
MAFTYKSLGQVRPSAAQSPKIYNLVKNPSFEGRSLEGWRMQTDSQYSSSYTRFYLNEDINSSAYDIPESYPATWGSDVCLYMTADDSRIVGIHTALDPIYTLSQGQIPNNFDGLVPVKSYKDYYLAFSIQRGNSNNASNYRWSVLEYDADMRFIQEQYLDGNADYANTGSTNKWQRYVSTITTNFRTQYASFSLRKTAVDNIYHYIDDLYFGEFQEYAQAPFNPDMPDLTYLAPFDKRRFGYIGEHHNSYTGRTFAGPLTNLYTVPSAKSAVISGLTITNSGKVISPYRVAIIPSGTSVANISLANFITFDEVIKPRQSRNQAQGITLGTGDSIYVAADSGEVTFQLFGAEVA